MMAAGFVPNTCKEEKSLNNINQITLDVNVKCTEIKKSCSGKNVRKNQKSLRKFHFKSFFESKKNQNKVK